MANESLKAKKEAFDAKVEKALAKNPERVNLPKLRLATPLDIEGFDYEKDLGMPGEYPFTRGVQPTMYRGRFWTMRMYAGFSTAEESNKRYRYLLESGGTGLSCAFDLPTQIGLDSDDPKAEGEIGKVGVAIDSLADMEILFDQIDLGKVSTSMTINAPASVLLAMIGIGGIATAEDALEFILAGASAVQVGTANFYNPQATTAIIDGISAYLCQYQEASLAAIVGGLRHG